MSNHVEFHQRGDTLPADISVLHSLSRLLLTLSVCFYSHPVQGLLTSPSGDIQRQVGFLPGVRNIAKKKSRKPSWSLSLQIWGAEQRQTSPWVPRLIRNEADLSSELVGWWQSCSWSCLRRITLLSCWLPFCSERSLSTYQVLCVLRLQLVSYNIPCSLDTRKEVVVWGAAECTCPAASGSKLRNFFIQPWVASYTGCFCKKKKKKKKKLKFLLEIREGFHVQKNKGINMNMH